MIEFHPAARQELAEAIAYYNGEKEGLGARFLLEVRRALGQIRAMPNAWAKVSPRARRYRLRRFPYGIVYRPGKDSTVILAIMHLSRRPGYWKDRQ